MITGGVFDIVFVDHNLKDKGSLELIEDLSLGGILPPTIFFTGKGKEKEIAQVLKLGVNDYIVKDARRKYMGLVPIMIDRNLNRKKRVEMRYESGGETDQVEREKTAILDSISEMVMFIGNDMNVIWANSAIAESVSVSPRELLGHRCYHVLLNNIDVCEGCPIIKARKTGKSEEAEIVSEDGKAWFVKAYPVVDDSGNVEGVVEVKRDITAQKEWEEKLKQASNEWRITFDSITDMIAIIDSDYRFIKVNKALADTFSMEPKELVGKMCYEYLADGDAVCQDCPHKEILLNGKAVQLERFDSRVESHLQISVSPLFNDGDGVMGSVIIYKDITQRKEAEEKLKEYSGHLKQMVGDLTKELMDAPELLIDKAKNAVLKQLARGVGNELRKPLEKISKNVFSLKNRIPKENSSAHKSLETIATELRKTEQIMLLLFYFSRPKTPDKKEVKINELVQGVLEKYPPSGNIKVISDISDDLPPVFVDPIQTGQVINNLIINADQSMSGGGELGITADLSKEGVLLSISDKGPGIPNKNLKKLFDPLSTTSAGKMGIGLAISKNLIESNGGSISVKSDEMKGSTFTVLLPTKK